MQEPEAWELYPDDSLSEDMAHRGRIMFLERCYELNVEESCADQ